MTMVIATSTPLCKPNIPLMSPRLLGGLNQACIAVEKEDSRVGAQLIGSPTNSKSPHWVNHRCLPHSIPSSVAPQPRQRNPQSQYPLRWGFNGHLGRGAYVPSRQWITVAVVCLEVVNLRTLGLPCWYFNLMIVLGINPHFSSRASLPLPPLCNTSLLSSKTRCLSSPPVWGEPAIKEILIVQYGFNHCLEWARLLI